MGGHDFKSFLASLSSFKTTGAEEAVEPDPPTVAIEPLVPLLAPIAPAPEPAAARPDERGIATPPLSLEAMFQQLLEWRGSDLHLSAGLPPTIRIHGDIYATEFPTLSHADVMALLFPAMTERERDEFTRTGDVDFSIEVPGLARFRVNCLQQYRGMAAVFRVIPHEVPRLEDLGLPPAIGAIARYRKGLILVTGPTGSGKSTTMAAMINAINESRRAHIITIEDPLEFIHPSKNCLVSHREIGRDASGFADALRAALREDPDIVLVGEMRDLDTVRQAIKAAEMGLLVLGTLHTNHAAKAIDRIIDIYPANEQDQVRTMLSESLRAVVAQQLVKRADGHGRAVVQEILIATPGLGNMIREGKTHQIASVIQTGRDVGMQSMDMALIDLVQRHVITPAVARERATDLRGFLRAGINFEDAGAPLS